MYYNLGGVKMSLFLGKIHYWLFNKILWFEGLEEEIIKLAQKEGLDVDSMKRDIEGRYGERLPKKDLSEMIDQSNIHGWLQSKIHAAEGRTAAWTKAIMDHNKDSLSSLESLYIEQGVKAAKEVKATHEYDSAKDIFNSMNDYILDGMPCDRVNEVITMEDDRVDWNRRVCVHKEVWETEGVNVDLFYNLRSLWIKAFVNEINDEFEYTEEENGLKSIRRK